MVYRVTYYIKGVKTSVLIYTEISIIKRRYLAERIVILAKVGECKIVVDEDEQHGGQEARGRRGEEREAREQGQMCYL